MGVRAFWTALALSALALANTPAKAHHLTAASGALASGVSIPSLTHGQMAVIAKNLPAIRALARSRIGFDMTLWRLEDYLNLQSFACFWGLAPGAVTDETSPFNECAHAYLAAARALLLRLRDAPGADHVAVKALIAKIETEMAIEGAALTLCRFSDQPFNTNDVVWPRWSAIPFHSPSAAFALLLLGAVGLGAARLAPSRQKRQSGRRSS